MSLAEGGGGVAASEDGGMGKCSGEEGNKRG